MKFRPLLLTSAILIGVGIGCTLAVDFEDHPADGGTKKDTSVPDVQTFPDTSQPDTTPSYDPECVAQGPFTGLPKENDAAIDAGALVVCCNGQLTDLTASEHCGGCGIDCNTGGNGYLCETYVGDAGAHAYCTGCLTKFGADKAGANASCQTLLCSASPPFASEGRCAPSNGGTDCVDAVCENVYGGATCARYKDGGSWRDPSFFCIYK